MPAPETPIGSSDELLAFFAAGAKPEGGRLLGVELERLPIRRDGTAAPFAGEGPNVKSLLSRLGAASGFEPLVIDGQVLGLLGASRDVHLEPGAQVELVLAPKATAREIAAELATWDQELREASSATGVHAIALGLQPVTPIADIEWIPKRRYEIMRSHLGARGPLAHHMMKGTAALQVTVDFVSEEDAAGLVTAALSVAPLVNAMVVNAPLENGGPNGALSRRPEIWRHTDASRCGLLPWIFEEGFSFRRYVDWALSVPVMFLVRDGSWRAVGDLTFGDLLQRGHPTLGPALHGDFHLHLTTLFPEVRLKQQVEIRGADSSSPAVSAAIAALWRGLLYDREARIAATAATAELTVADRAALHAEVGRRGLAARLGDGLVREACQDLLGAARAGLERTAAATATAPEGDLLAPLDEIVATGRTPADDLLARWTAGDRSVALGIA